MYKFFLNASEAAVVIIDMQEKLARAMDKDVLEDVVKNILTLIELGKLFNIPFIVAEQYPKGLGNTLEEISKAVKEFNPIEKISFSCVAEPSFMNALEQTHRRKIVLTGMETHVCVWQTALDLLSRGYYVYVPKDAVCSRRKEDWKTALDLIKDAGGVVTVTEALVFQILKKAGTQEFKKMLEWVK
ncbi:MAG: hypothetical protein PWQ91_545 [Eubacteriales bacterium]|nr:hypothetical protein [Eubacteriales bacterium]